MGRSEMRANVRMKVNLQSALMLAAGLGIIYVSWRAWLGIKRAAQEAGRIAAQTGEDVRGFVTGETTRRFLEAPLPTFAQTRNIDPLIAYFDREGNTNAARQAAAAAGWTTAEVNYAVTAWAASKRRETGDWY